MVGPAPYLVEGIESAASRRLIAQPAAKDDLLRKWLIVPL